MLPMTPDNDYVQTLVFAGGMTPERDDVRDALFQQKLSVCSPIDRLR